jgi:hypothetical protein
MLQITATELITRIRGSSACSGSCGIKFLEFSNSKGVCGTCGKKRMGATLFTFELDCGITGLHGRADSDKLMALEHCYREPEFL